MSGKKTQTRRAMKPQPKFDKRSCLTWKGGAYGIQLDGKPYIQELIKESPFGFVGDRLLVKEGIEGRNDTKLHDGEQMPITAYTADGSHIWDGPRRLPWRWKPKSLPSIYMPKELCRTVLQITNVRIEQLHAITAKDILSEGVVDRQHKVEGLSGDCPVSAIDGAVYPDLRTLWAEVWIKINGMDSWNSNPYVWVIEFKKVVAS